MTTSNELDYDDDSYDSYSSSQSSISAYTGDLVPRVLENEHSRLMSLQGKTDDGTLLVEDARRFVTQVKELGSRLDNTRARQHWQGILDYWSIFAYRVAQVDLDTHLLEYDPSLAPELRDDQYPYRFTEESAVKTQQMLGWRRLLDECGKDLCLDQLLTVVGEEGSGRRFLLQDLLLPILRAGKMPQARLKGSEEWQYYNIEFGENPVEDLVRCVAQIDGHDDQWVRKQVSLVEKSPEKFAGIIDAGSDRPKLLLFQDFELLLKLSKSRRKVMVDALASLQRDANKRFFLAVTLTREQTHSLRKFGSLEKPLRDGHVLLAFTTSELRHLITDPARQVGLEFDPGVVDKILIDIQGEPTALPLLQFTMHRLWRRRERNRITDRAFRSSGAGAAAIRKAMDKVYGRLSEDQKKVLRKILLEFINLEASSRFVTIPVSRSDLRRIGGDPEIVDQILDQLLRQDLVYLKSVGNEQMVALSSRNVLTTWPPLIEWLDERKEQHRFRLRLKAAADLWHLMSKRDDLLWFGIRLVEAEEEYSKNTPLSQPLTTPEKEFLKASRRRENARKWRKGTMLFLLASALLAPILTFPYVSNRIERQQGHYDDAIVALMSGDQPGTLLHLEKFDKERLFFDFASEEQKRNRNKIRQLIELQMPRMSFRKAGPIGKEAKNGSAKSNAQGNGQNFVDMAISPNRSMIATVVFAENKKSYEVAVCKSQDIEHVSFKDTLKNTDDPARATKGTVTFATVGKKEYLLFGAKSLFFQDASNLKMEGWGELKIKDVAQNAVPPENRSNNRRGNRSFDRSGGLNERAPEKFEGVQTIESNGNWLAIVWDKHTAWEKQTEQLETKRRVLTLHSLTADAGQIELGAPIKYDDSFAKNVRQIALNRQGDLVVVCGVDNQPSELKAFRKLRDQDTNNPKWSLAKPPSWVQEMNVQDSGRRLSDWGWSFKERHSSWNSNESFIRAVSFSPAGTQFLTASDDGQVLAWDFGDDLLVNDLRSGSAHNHITFTKSDSKLRPDAELTVCPRMETELRLGSSVIDVAFINEELFVTGGRDRTARIWDLGTGVEVAPRTFHEGTVSDVEFLIESKKLITRTAQTIQSWDFADVHRLIQQPEGVQHVAVNVSPDGSQIVCTTDTERRLPFVTGSVDPVNLMSTMIAPSGEWSLSTYSNKHKRQTVKTLRILHRRKVDEKFKSFKDIAVPAEKLVGKLFTVFGPNRIQSAKRWLFVAEATGTNRSPNIVALDLDSDEPGIQSKDFIPVPEFEKLTEDSCEYSLSEMKIRQIAVTNYSKKTVLAMVGEQAVDQDFVGFVMIGVIEGETWRLYHLRAPGDEFAFREEALCVGFSPKGDRLAAGGVSDEVKVWRTKDLLKSINALNNSDSASKEFRDTIELSPINTLRHSSDVVSLVFSAEQKPAKQNQVRELLLATVSSEGEASLWNTRRFGQDEPDSKLQEPDFRIRHNAKILSLSFSPSGNWIITGGRDRTARVWTRKGEPIGIFKHRFSVVGAWILGQEETEDEIANVLTFSRRFEGSPKNNSSNDRLRIRCWDSRSSNSISEQNLRNYAARDFSNTSQLERADIKQIPKEINDQQKRRQ